MRFTGRDTKKMRWRPKVQGLSVILPFTKCCLCLSLGGGGTKPKRGGHDFTITKNATCAPLGCYSSKGMFKRLNIKTFRTKAQLKVCSDGISWV